MSVECVISPKDHIFELMKRDDLKGFTGALSYYGSEIADSVDGIRSLLEEACRRGRDAAFVRELLKAGADVNHKNPLGRTALHFAVEQGNADAIEELLGIKRPQKEHCVANVNAVDCEGLTALHVLCKLQHENIDEAHVKERLLRCLEVLLSVPELDVNRLSFMGKTAIYIAAENMRKDIVEKLLREKRTLIDVDLIPDDDARKIIIKNFPALEESVKLKPKTSKTFRLVDLLHRDGEEEFKKTFEDLKENKRLKEALQYENGPCTLLQRASGEGLIWAVNYLLENGVDCNETCSNNSILPSQLAAQRGHDDVLRVLMGKGAKLASPDGETALHYVLRFGNPKDDNYKKCFDMLINSKFHNKSYASEPECYDAANKKGNTPLHLAAQYHYHDFVLSLLKKGAYIGSLNSEGIPPVAYIYRDTLKEFLDSRVASERSRRDQGYKIIFDVKFMKDPLLKDDANIVSSSITDSDREQGKSNKDHQSTDIEPENYPSTEYNCEPLAYMSKLEDIKDLLTHPVFKCFIYYKWKKISITYLIELAIKWFFVTSITWYVLGFSSRAIENPSLISVNDSLVSNESLSSRMSDLERTTEEEEEEELIGVSRIVAWFFSFTFYVIVSLVQVFKVLAIWNDFFSLDNFLEMLLIVTSGIVLFANDLECNRHFCATTMLLSWTTLLLLIGKHPKLSTNIEMLKTVSRNFIYFLLWYILILIAFSLSFYALYRNSPENTLFASVGASVFKTLVMVTGDFETDKHPMEVAVYTSHFIFLLFVFMVVIILMNLLNALAVDDIHTIRKDSEMLGIISRVTFIANTEKARKSLCGKCHNFSSKVAQIWGSVKNLCLPSRDPRQSKVKKKVFDGNISIFPNEIATTKSQPDKKCFRKVFPYLPNLYDRINYSIIRDAEIILSSKTTA